MPGIKKKETDYIKCCLNCEFAHFDDSEDYPSTVFCVKAKKTKDSDAKCRHHIYDPLKRKPFRPAELPSLDPDAILLWNIPYNH